MAGPTRSNGVDENGRRAILWFWPCSCWICSLWRAAAEAQEQDGCHYSSPSRSSSHRRGGGIANIANLSIVKLPQLRPSPPSVKRTVFFCADQSQPADMVGKVSERVLLREGMLRLHSRASANERVPPGLCAIPRLLTYGPVPQDWSGPTMA